MKEKQSQTTLSNLIDIRQNTGAVAGQTTWTLSANGLTSLTNCRACLMWRYAGESEWRIDWTGLPKLDANGCDTILDAGPLKLHLVLKQRQAGGWIFSGELRNEGVQAVELARLHYLDGKLEQPDEFMMIAQSAHGVSPIHSEFCFFQGRQSPPLIKSLGGNSVSDPIYEAPNWACAIDSAAIAHRKTGLAWFCGTVGPGVAYGQVGLNTYGLDVGRFFVGQMLDNILLPAGKTRTLESIEIMVGDWQTALQEWAVDCARGMDAAPPRPPLTGFCSWYRNFAEITVADVDAAIREFSELPNPPGGKNIQIDDGFQLTCGDWRPNARFASIWNELPGKIKAKGMIPSLWLAPTFVQDTLPVFKEHPDWFQRMPDGQFASSMSNWGWCDDPTWIFGTPGGHIAYALDPDHPDARAHIKQMLKEIVAQGWEGLKLDFGVLVTGRAAYDRSKTSFETFRDCYRLYREAVGPDILINACVGGPARYVLGLADSARNATDMIGNWQFFRSVTPLLMLRMMATNGIWWASDPDVFWMRRKNNEAITGSYFEGPEYGLKTTEEEQYLLMATYGLMGVMFHTSDLPSEWTDEGRKRILEFWGTNRPTASKNVRIAWDLQTGFPRGLRCEMMRNGHNLIACALYNWNDDPQTVSVGLHELGLDSTGKWSLEPDSQGIELKNGRLISTQPPHSLRRAYMNGKGNDVSV